MDFPAGSSSVHVTIMSSYSQTRIFYAILWIEMSLDISLSIQPQTRPGIVKDRLMK